VFRFLQGSVVTEMVLQCNWANYMYPAVANFL